MDKIIAITIIILIIFCIMSNYNYNKTASVDKVKESFKNASSFPNNNWSNIAKNNCQQLKKNIQIPNNLIKQDCYIPSSLKERDAINNGVSCLENINRTIFNDREQKSWCAAAKNKESKDYGFYSAQSNEIVYDNLVDIPTTNNENKNIIDLEQINQIPTKTCPGMNVNIDYSIINNKDFMQTNSNKLYAVPHKN